MQTISSFFLFICMMAVLSGCSGGASLQATPTAIPTSIIPVKPVYTVQLGPIADVLEFTGRVTPLQEMELAFGVSGRVDEVLVMSGDLVLQGDLLATLETSNRASELRQAEINLEMAQHELRLAQELARQELEQAALNAPVLQAEAELEIIEAKTALDQAQNRRSALGNLDGQGLVTQAMLLAGAELKVAQAKYDRALARLELLDQQAQELELAQATQLALKEGQVELAQIALDEIKTYIADSQIFAPFSGQVVSVYLRPDTAVEAYQTGIILVDTVEMEIRADPGAANLQRLEENMPVIISPVGNPGTILEGFIRSLPYPYGSGESTQEDARIQAAGDLSKAYAMGDLMEVTVILEQKEEALWLPPQAIRTFEGRKFVVIQEGEGQRRVDVKIGIQAEDRVEILEGLKAGQVVFSP
jgi:multidrug efflux pump subunit AcrA (membrane-fusion protein)